MGIFSAPFTEIYDRSTVNCPLPCTVPTCPICRTYEGSTKYSVKTGFSQAPSVKGSSISNIEDISSVISGSGVSSGGTSSCGICSAGIRSNGSGAARHPKTNTSNTQPIQRFILPPIFTQRSAYICDYEINDHAEECIKDEQPHHSDESHRSGKKIIQWRTEQQEYRCSNNDHHDSGRQGDYCA